jgi:hypothetical protein
VHDDKIETESTDPVSRFPYVSSVFTVNGTTVLTGVEDAGSVVKAILLMAAGVTVTFTAGDDVPPVGLSVATSEHEPVLAPPRMTPENVAFPEVPVVVKVRLPLGVNVQFVEDSVMVSPRVAAEYATVKPVPVFAATDAGGEVKDSVAAAEAGRTPTNAIPATTRAAADPSPRRARSLDFTELLFPVWPVCIFIKSPSSGRDRSSE